MSAIEVQSTFPITEMMDRLMDIEENVHEKLVVYRYRPFGPPQLESGGGAIYNLFRGGPHEVWSTETWKDRLTVLVRLGIRHTDSNDEMRMVELFGALLVHQIDFALHRMHPLGPVVKRAHRTGFRMLEDTFGETPVLAVECPIEVEFHRLIPANS